MGPPRLGAFLKSWLTILLIRKIGRQQAIHFEELQKRSAYRKHVPRPMKMTPLSPAAARKLTSGRSSMLGQVINSRPTKSSTGEIRRSLEDDLRRLRLAREEYVRSEARFVDRVFKRS